MQRMLVIEKKKILLDTNILIQGTGGKTEKHRRLIRDFCEQNAVCISDTVYYEFLRNCNFDTFRKRRVLIEDWPGMNRMRILRDSKGVQKMYEQLSLLYLAVMREEPRRYLHLRREDLWITAAAVYYDSDAKIDRILTTDHSGDFPQELFDDERFDLGDGLILHLKTFRRERAREIWIQLQKEKHLSLSLLSLL